MTRELGYYWVKSKKIVGWRVLLRDGENWYAAGDEDPLKTDTFAEIDEKRLEYPSEAARRLIKFKYKGVVPCYLAHSVCMDKRSKGSYEMGPDVKTICVSCKHEQGEHFYQPDGGCLHAGCDCAGFKVKT